MARMIPMDERYEFDTDAELNNAQIIPPANLMFIKTQLAMERRKLSNLRPDPNNYHLYVQEHAGISGAVSAYEYLITCHEEVIRRIAVD